jgi:hypothetical protein
MQVMTGAFGRSTGPFSSAVMGGALGKCFSLDYRVEEQFSGTISVRGELVEP